MLLSIVTINYNNIDGLRQTAESIFGQSSKDYEWIVIDGGSTDGSKEYIQSHAEHMAYWVSEPDRGVYHAMNKGTDRAKGDYIIYMNSGDLFYSHDTIDQFQTFVQSEGDIDIFYGNCLTVDDDGNPLYEYCPPERLSLKWLDGRGLCHQSVFFNRHCFDNTRYSEEYRICADKELILRLLFADCTFHKIDLIVSRFNNSGMSKTQKELTAREDRKSFESVVPKICYEDMRREQTLIDMEKHDVFFVLQDIIHSGNPGLLRIARWLLKPIQYFAKR